MRPVTPARRRRRRPGDDRGIVLPFVALMLVVLVGMGALVIDIGALYQERRRSSQSFGGDFCARLSRR